ncbi:hypothetical protein Bra3105_01605 [Brachybacterium halotolerans subsp. kimchii]|uniref:hypothetical protein n=1 Tax=Brachybacterium halotolerans TaxID=2795215 RepID=UPI001E4C1DA7|nr:hypothetical protein [Brachybacterium halotolerans]UEJ83053.1 hypothetical protein Bra3105_01605 [Brachybacterium halotolerans subsp. kimchii]
MSTATSTGASTPPRARRGTERLLDVLAPAIPLARLEVMRRLISAFVVFDVLLVSNDVIGHAANPEYFRPTALARLLHLPAVTPVLGWGLLVVILASGALGALGRAPRASGAVLAVSFWIWMLYSQGYGYISHDHVALMVAVAVLPTAGIAGARADRVDGVDGFGGVGGADAGVLSRQAGWALRCIQLAVVLTYFYSVLEKSVISGSPATWANSAVFAFAFIRRGAPWVQWMLDVPGLFRPAQWALIALETISPLALFLRGRKLYALIGVFLVFHLATFVALGIHFLPTVVCWAAFLPLERITARLRRWAGRRRAARADAARASAARAGAGRAGAPDPSRAGVEPE